MLEKFKGVWSKDAKIGENPLFLGALEGFLKTSKEEKGPQITYPENFMYSTFYLLINSNKFFLRMFLLILLHLGDSHFWQKILSLEEMQKDKIVKSSLMQKSFRVSDYKSKSFFVFKIINIINQ
jgi:hypothetical protein